MKSGSFSFYLGIIAFAASIIAAFMGHADFLPAGLILFSMGAMGRLFENEVIDCLLLTFVGVGALVFTLNFAQTHFGGHGSAQHSDKPAATAEEHH